MLNIPPCFYLPLQPRTIPNWKCVINCFSNCPPEILHCEDSQHNIDIENIKHHIFKEAGCYKVQSQRPLGVNSWCDMCQ